MSITRKNIESIVMLLSICFLFMGFSSQKHSVPYFFLGIVIIFIFSLVTDDNEPSHKINLTIGKRYRTLDDRNPLSITWNIGTVLEINRADFTARVHWYNKATGEHAERWIPIGYIKDGFIIHSSITSFFARLILCLIAAYFLALAYAFLTKAPKSLPRCVKDNIASIELEEVAISKHDFFSLTECYTVAISGNENSKNIDRIHNDLDEPCVNFVSYQKINERLKKTMSCLPTALVINKKTLYKKEYGDSE